mmetsp:Transcript_165361/g.292863  ORF Transcript_165361/g.292863 Transcript_165361/m.292863 type:complete len:82 (-) Transcript_165361:645-890(-)
MAMSSFVTWYNQKRQPLPIEAMEARDNTEPLEAMEPMEAMVDTGMVQIRQFHASLTSLHLSEWMRRRTSSTFHQVRNTLVP